MLSRVSRWNWIRLGGVVACASAAVLLVLSANAASTLPADDWQFDLIHTRNGKVHQGLLVAETTEYVKFWRIIRVPGRPTRRMFWSYETSDITKIERLSDDQRHVLEERIRALDPDHEKQCMERLKLLPTAWGGEPNGGLCYRSDYFLLVSDAREEIVRRAAFRLERIYAALARFMPPRRMAPPTRILLVRSQQEYQTLLAKRGLHFLNPAFYDRDRQEIVCACDLERFGEELAAAQLRHRQNRERLRAQERALEREHRGNIPQKLMKPLNQQFAALDEADRTNEHQFEESSKRFFETLYHEACHAYVATFVYAKTDKMPSWLQEGLAQIFESAILDGMEFRVGHLDAARVERLRTAGRRGDLPGLLGLLRAGPRQFMANHTQEKSATDSYYLSAWALAHYLVFDRELLGSAELDRYVTALEGGADPLAAFEQLVDEPIASFVKSMPPELRLSLTAGENSIYAGDRRP
ncbi:MAG TPA: DUF1570 domain-containing protein [Gemmataceae bacterium]|jgi:hypothetical protein|nr:DUF1570 domain-containing protein [Gemmataceae bacterium]